MAFNLIHNFRKYQRFWIAGVLFVCMVTFVLCTGLGQGGLDDRIISWTQGLFGNKGKVVFVLDGTNIYGRELEDVKKQREIANDFMREATTVTLRRVEDVLKDKEGKIKRGEIKDAKKLEEEKVYRSLLQQVVNTLQAQLSNKTRFFGSGTKTEELMDFMLWRQQASRLNINLVENHVKIMIENHVVGPINSMNTYLNQKYKIYPLHPRNFWDDDAARLAMHNVRQNHYGADYENTMAALKDEFKVQMAQFFMMGYKQFDYNEIEKDVLDVGYQIRFPLTPNQLWNAFKKDTTKFDVALLPIEVEKYVDQVPEPTRDQLQALFKDHQKQPINPASDKPGFIQPEEYKLQYVTADPDAKFYKERASLVTTLETIPPLYVDFGLPGLGAALRYVSGKPALDSILNENYDRAKYENIINLNRQVVDNLLYGQTPLTEPTFELSLYSSRPPDAKAVAGLIGFVAVGTPGLLVDGATTFQAAAYFDNKDKFESAVTEEIQRRVPVGMALVMAAASPLPIDVIGNFGVHQALGEQTTFLPFGIVEPEFREKKEKEIASKFAQDVMEGVQSDLRSAQGKAKEFNARLDLVKKKYKDGIVIYESKGFVNPFTGAKDPGMEKLRKAFEEQKTLDFVNMIEGRAGTDKKLTSDDFYKLFFDTSESFSLAGAGNFTFRQWPPEVTPKQAISLEDFGHDGGEVDKGVKFSLWLLGDDRFLFWKTASKEPKFPEKLEDVEEEVRTAWKFQEARKKAWEAAKEFAIGLSKNQQIKGEGGEGADYMPAILAEAAKQKSKPITFENATRKVPVGVPGQMGKVMGVKYEMKTIPKGTGILYPRDNMHEDVFSLFDLTGPLPYWNKAAGKDTEQAPGNDKDVHELNEKLFVKEFAPRHIQVLTNKPRSVYYVVVVNKATPPKLDEFMKAYSEAKARATFEANFFVMMARSEAALQFRDALTQQLRKQYVKDMNLGDFN